eukprot:1196014-Prorocentrum_minimum.AAC.2
MFPIREGHRKQTKVMLHMAEPHAVFSSFRAREMSITQGKHNIPPPATKFWPPSFWPGPVWSSSVAPKKPTVTSRRTN